MGDFDKTVCIVNRENKKYQIKKIFFNNILTLFFLFENLLVFLIYHYKQLQYKNSQLKN